MEKTVSNPNKTKVRQLQQMHAVSNYHNTAPATILHFGNKATGIARPVNKTATRYLLNWEFFSNELEYE
jgi:hypothetical protein